jgi:hypothetical protein
MVPATQRKVREGEDMPQTRVGVEESGRKRLLITLCSLLARCACASRRQCSPMAASGARPVGASLFCVLSGQTAPNLVCSSRHRPSSWTSSDRMPYVQPRVCSCQPGRCRGPIGKKVRVFGRVGKRSPDDDGAVFPAGKDHCHRRCPHSLKQQLALRCYWGGCRGLRRRSPMRGAGSCAR